MSAEALNCITAHGLSTSKKRKTENVIDETFLNENNKQSSFSTTNTYDRP